jgi:hypothetical protein
MKNLTLCETNKLFYNQYLYKLAFSNNLNVIFRQEFQKDKKLSYAREQIDKFAEQYRNNEPIMRQIWRTAVQVPEQDYLDAKELYSILKRSSDYKIRIDPQSTITIFSNNEDFLLEIAGRLKAKNKVLHKPNENYAKILQEKTKIILVDKKPDLKLKINFNSKRCNKEFANWIRANTDKARMGRIALENLESYGYLSGFYMYVRDEKVLNLVTLLAGNTIRSVEKLVYKGDIDKYKYAE